MKLENVCSVCIRLSMIFKIGIFFDFLKYCICKASLWGGTHDHTHNTRQMRDKAIIFRKFVFSWTQFIHPSFHFISSFLCSLCSNPLSTLQFVLTLLICKLWLLGGPEGQKNAEFRWIWLNFVQNETNVHQKYLSPKVFPL